jgi:hypothetical protein
MLCLMLVTLGPSAMISDLNLLLFYDDNCCLWSYLQVVYTYRCPEPRPQSDNNWDNQRGWLWCEDHMCSLSVNALLRYSIKRSTLITSSFPWGPATNELVGQKMSCKFLIASTYDYIRNTCLGLFSSRMLYLYLSVIAHVLFITWIILSISMPTVFNPTVYYWYSYCLYFAITATILLQPLL